MARLKASLEITVEYRDYATDPDSLCLAFDRLIATALGDACLLDEYGVFSIGTFSPIEEADEQGRNEA